jgi:hypothetical protein
LLVAGGAHDAIDVVCRDLQQPGIFGDPRIAGGADQLRSALGAGQRLDERVLAPATAKDENPWGCGGAAQLRSRR